MVLLSCPPRVYTHTCTPTHTHSFPLPMHTHTPSHFLCTCADSLFNGPDTLETSVLNPKVHGVPIATANGQLSVNVKIKQNESEPGPKLEVNGFLGSLHLLISPQQMSMLLEMATGITSQGMCVCHCMCVQYVSVDIK